MNNAKIDITKGRSDAFDASARRLWGFIDELNIGACTCNELVDLISV